MNIFIFNGRPDGIGNRIEQLIYIQEYCLNNNLVCIYIWNNKIKYRTYDILINFKNIIIKEKLDINDNYPIYNSNIFQRTYNNLVYYNFNFNLDFQNNYDVIIHIRGTDRLTNNKHPDFSNINELNKFINKTINYVNNNDSIFSYTVISDDIKYIQNIKNKIKKKFITLYYNNNNISKDWIDFYYLTRVKNEIIMCSKFSSFSITASILANKCLCVFSESLNSSLGRYKANIKII